MAKVSPILRSFNGGEFSVLMDGRSDIDRYPSSMRKLYNYIAVPQGPAVGRSGTMFVTPVHDETKRSAILPFIFSEGAGQAFILEFAHLTMRVITEAGVLINVGVPYTLATPWTDADVQKLRVVQSGNILYMMCEGFQPRKLTRYGATSWTLELYSPSDGPYLPVNDSGTRLTPSGTGQLAMTETVTLPAAAQTVVKEYVPTSPAAITGYYLKATGGNTDPDYSALDQAPSDWRLEGWDGFGWTLIDQKKDHVLYENKRTPFFRILDGTVWEKYRILCDQVRRNGIVFPDFTAVFSTAGSSFTMYASDTFGINRNQGFKPTDVGRLIRYKNVSDGSWAALTITFYASPTQVNVIPQSAPLADAFGTGEWRLGYWSDTTGWPTCGTFFDDRLWLGGSVEYPDVVAGSRTGSYEDMAQTNEAGVVSDDNAVVFQLNSRKISRISWMQSDERGLLIGTGSGEWSVTAGASDAALTARAIKARNSTARGSANVEPVKVDRQVIYIQRSRRTVREMSYVFEADGYKSPSMSLFSSHIGVPRFAEMDYAAEPHSIIWFRRDDGIVVGLTYNREENVVGWHTHNFANGVVESLAVVPAADGEQDALWIAVRRVVGGVTRRFVERLTRFWDFDMTLDDVHLVDSALRYEGAPVSFVTGLNHLEGVTVYGLADGSPVSGMVNSGRFDLPEGVTAGNIILGLPYDAIGVTNRIEAGAADGTSQGKTKRVHKAVVRMWQSVGGLIGRSEDDLVEIASRRPEDLPGALPLRDSDEIIDWPEGYDSDCLVVFKRPGEVPLPLNIIAVMPQLVTQDAR